MTVHQLMTAPEVATLLRLPLKSVYDLVAMRRIPVVRLGSRLRFDHSDVLAWIAKHRVPSLEDQ
jgi:excisionase family DNA binding protein